MDLVLLPHSCFTLSAKIPKISDCETDLIPHFCVFNLAIIKQTISWDPPISCMGQIQINSVLDVEKHEWRIILLVIIHVMLINLEQKSSRV